MEKIELNKLAPEAACKGNPKWEQMISRKQELYTAKIDFRTEIIQEYYTQMHIKD